MYFKSLPSLFLVINFSTAHQIHLYNHCYFPIWPGIQGDLGCDHLEGGGFELDYYQHKIINTPNDWSGRIWARTKCNATGSCETGDCGNKIQCNGTIGESPATFVEMDFSGAGGLDFYYVSLLEGYNLPVQIKPLEEFQKCGKSESDCKLAGCKTHLNVDCPPELAVDVGDVTVACNHPCAVFETDEYCCEGNYSTAQTCNEYHSSTNYTKIFEYACPHAFRYEFDDSTKIFSCRTIPNATYFVKFC